LVFGLQDMKVLQILNRQLSSPMDWISAPGGKFDISSLLEQQLEMLY
jgi:hypothetical protein